MHRIFLIPRWIPEKPVEVTQPLSNVEIESRMVICRHVECLRRRWVPTMMVICADMWSVSGVGGFQPRL